MRVAPALIVCALAFSTAAHGGYFEIHWTETWRVTKGRPYALWKAKSEIAADSVAIAENGGVIDRAYLLPQELFRTEEEILEGGSLLLPKGSLLIKMQGGDGNNYCTWAYEKRLNSNEWVEKVPVVNGIIPYLCFKASPNNIVYYADVFQGIYPALFTIFRVGSGLFGKKTGTISPSRITRVESEDYLKSAEFRVTVKFVKTADIRKPCLVGGVSRPSVKTLELSSAPICFADAGGRIAAWGGVYTLVKQQDDQLSIRVDQPIDQPAIGPVVEN